MSPQNELINDMNIKFNNITIKQVVMEKEIQSRYNATCLY